MLLSIGFILLGFVLLMKGGDYLVEGSVSIARLARLSPMVIGLTVVGFGTSSPELLVSTEAALAGSPGIAIGNVVGSNIANIALILGVTGIICRIPVKKATFKVDLPFMMLSVVLMAVAGMMGTIRWWEGLIGLTLLAVYVVGQILHSRKNPDPDAEASLAEFRQHGIWMALFICLLSGAALVIGANLLVKGASDVAMRLGGAMGVDPKEMERIVGLTIVAVGTSLPELFASVQAARRGQTDMALGNIMGAVTFNIFCVISTAAIVCPIENTDVGFAFDYLAMLVVSLLLLFFLRTSYSLARWEGAILLLLYTGYITKTCFFN